MSPIANNNLSLAVDSCQTSRVDRSQTLARRSRPENRWVDTPMNGETLFEATDYFRPFPPPQQVFGSNIEKHAEFLLPVATVSLDHLSRDWNGKIHFVIPIEPGPGWGVVGDNSHEYHTYLCRPNWVGFKITNSKYELASDFRFFHKEYYASHVPTNDLAVQEFEELPEHYEESRKQFAISSTHFAQQACLQNRQPLVEDLGGLSVWSNWSNTGDMPLSKSLEEVIFEETEVLPKTEDGRDFFYIGSMSLWNYFEHHSGVLLLFYDPLDRIALTTVDWT